MRRRGVLASSAVLFAGCGTPSADSDPTPTPQSVYDMVKIGVQDPIDFGDKAWFFVVLKNIGDATGSRLVQVFVGGTNIYGDEVELVPQEETKIEGEFDTNILDVGDYKMVVEVGDLEAEVGFTIEDVFDYEKLASAWESALQEGFLAAKVEFKDDEFKVHYATIARTPEGIKSEIAAVVVLYTTAIQEYVEPTYRPKGVEATVYNANMEPLGWWDVWEEWIREWMNDEMTLEKMGNEVRETFVPNYDLL